MPTREGAAGHQGSKSDPEAVWASVGHPQFAIPKRLSRGRLCAAINTRDEVIKNTIDEQRVAK
jgi:hypothetical protein